MAEAPNPLADLLSGVNPVSGLPEASNSTTYSFVDALSGGALPQPTASAPSAAPAPRQGLLTEFGRGVGSGVQQLKSDIQSLGAVGADIFGADETAQEWASLAGKTQEEANRDYPTTVQRIEDIQGPTDFAYWAARTLGEQTPVIASILLGGGAGGLLGRAVGRGLLSLPQASAALARLGSLGAGAGAITTATGIETGATANETFEAVGRLDPGVALSAGIAKGALEALVPSVLGARIGITPDLTRGLIGKLIGTFDRVVPNRLAAAGATGFGEALTEALQETIDTGVRGFVDDNYNALGPEGASRILNAATAGGFIGFLFGGLAGGMAHGRQSPQINAGDTGPDDLEPHTAPIVFEPPQRGETAISTGTVPPDAMAQVLAGEGYNPQITRGPIRPEGFAANLLHRQYAPEPEQYLQPAQTEPVLSQAVAVVNPQDVGAGISFRKPQEGQVEEAFAQPGARTVRLDTRNLQENDLSAELSALPPTIQISDENVRFLNPDKAEAALKAVQDAIRLRETAVSSALTGEHSLIAGQGELALAEQLYRNALALGFRYVPKPTDGFVLAREPNPGELFVDENTAFQPPIFTGPRMEGEPVPLTYVRPRRLSGTGVSYVGGPGPGLVPLSPRARKFLGPYGAEGGEIPQAPEFYHDRAFSFDRTKLPEGDLVDFEPSFVRYSKLGEYMETAVQSPTEAEVRELLRESPSMYLAENADVVAIGTAVRQMTQTSSQAEQGNALARAVAAGLRIRPTETSESVVFVGSQTQLARAITTEVPSGPAGQREPSLPWDQIQGLDEELAFAKVTDLDGNAFDLEAMPDGTATMVLAKGTTLDKRQKAIFKKLEKFYNQWMKKFGVTDKKLVIFTEGHPRFNAHLAGANGVLVPWSPDVQAIGIKIPRVVSDSYAIDVNTRAWWMTATHEFGHFLGFTKLLEQDGGTTARIISAYNRSLVKASLGRGRDYAEAFASPTRTFPAQMDRIEAGRIEPDFGRATNETEVGLRSEYWLNFDEWFADQVARYVFSYDAPALDPVERMFKAIARQIRILFRDVVQAIGIKNFKPTEEVTELLNSWKTETRTKQPALTTTYTATSAARYRSQAQVASVLKDTLPFGDPRKAPEGSPLGSRVQGLFSKLGLKGQEFDETIADLDYFNTIAKYGFNVFQLADKNKHLGQLQRYKELLDQWWVYKMGIISRADERVREWRALDRRQTDALSQFIFDVDQMNFLAKKEKADGVARWPTDAELEALIQKHKLEPETFELYNRVKGDFLNILDEIEQTAIIDVRRTYSDPTRQDFEVFDIQKEFDALRARPYFPHSRFGDYAIVVKDKKGKTLFMEQFETKRAAIRAIPAVLRSYPKGEFNTRLDAIPKSVQPFRGLPPSLLKAIRNRLALTDEQKTWLDQMLVEFLPSSSFRKRLSKRENVPGFSLDAMRSYANYFFHGANYFARIRYFDVLQDEINSLDKNISQLSQGLVDVTKRRRIQEYMQDHFNYTMNPGRDWAQARSLAFQWWLGFSPVSAAVNFTQIPMVAWPYLGSRFGNVVAANELRKAAQSIPRIYRNKEGSIPDNEFRAINRGIEQGFLDESQATELAGVSEGDNLQRLLPGTAVQRFLMQSAHWSAFLFQASEKINRRVTFRAAYRLAKKNPNAEYLSELISTEHLEYNSLVGAGYSDTEAKAFLAGKDAVRRTQFEYAQHARPKFMQGKAGTVLTFFMFVQNMVYFASHSPGRTKYLLMLLLAAGVMGLPGAEDLAAIAKFAARNLLGKDVDLERELRELIVELTGGGEAADLILHGTSRVGFGLPDAMDKIGIPFPKFDLSASISMGQIVPGVSELGRPGLDFEERFANVSTDIAGAAFGIGINLLKFLSDDSLPIDDVKRWERAVPRALRNILRASRYADEGRERTRTGATLVEFDASDPLQLSEIVGQFLGFTPTRVTRKWDRITMQREAAAFWEVRKGMLLSQYDHAYTVGGREAERDVKTAIRRYNDEVPFPQMRISGKTLSDSRKERIRRRRRTERGIPQSRKEIPLYREIERLTPEASESISVEDVSRLR